MVAKEIIETEILSNGMDGEGIARIDGKVVFIPYTIKGERVRAVVKQVRSRYAVASVIKVLDSSPHRVSPSCPHYFKCGGCDTMHIDGEYRREILLGELKNNLKKIAGIDYTPSVFVSGGSGLRNKISMPFGFADGRVVAGLYRQNTHTVESVDCAACGPRSKQIAETVCEFANAKRLSAYDGRTGKGLLRHIVLREADRVSATLVINAERFDCEDELASLLPEYCDFFISPNTARNNVILGETVRLVKGNARLSVNVCGVRAELSPLSFFQVNDEIRDRLYAAAIGEISSPELIDLYSGIGITSNLAAKKCRRVTAVECVPQAVADADRTAEINGNREKTVNICGAVEDVLGGLRVDGKVTDVLVDPPRKGCDGAVMRAIADISPNRVIYISCNHATMCRDIKLLSDLNSYTLAKCELFDMFPNTHHTETLCVLERSLNDKR